MKFLKKFFFGNTQATTITFIGSILVLLVIALGISSRQRPQTSEKIVWAAFDGGGSRSGVNALESLIDIGNVKNLTLVWQKALPFKTNGSPVEIPNVQTTSGVKDLLYITTQRGSLVALDAATGTKIWQADTQGNFVGGQGTSSSPAVDPSNQFVYSYGIDGKVHKFSAATGQESQTNGFPATITISTDVEKISAPLNVGNGFLYVVTSGYDGDFGQYVGHLVATNLSTGTSTVFNSLCSNVKQISQAGFCPEKGSGIWGRAGAVVDPETDNVFVVTGNGNYNGITGGSNYGDSVVELTGDLSRIVDSYTPTTFDSLDSQDDDLGSTGVVLLPKQATSTTPNLLVLGGKDNKIRLLNKDNLSGAGGPNHTGGELQTVATPCQTLAHPIAWNDTTNTTWVFVTDTCANLTAYKVVTTNGKTQLQQVYQKGNMGKNSVFMANNILFVPNSNSLSAVNPTTGAVLWSSTQAGGNIGTLHWQSPIVVNGGVYMPDENGNLSAYGIPASAVTPLPTTAPTTAPTTPATPTPAGNTITFSLTIGLDGIGSAGDSLNPQGKGNSTPKHPTRTLTLTVLKNNNQVTTATGQITFASSGFFTGNVNVGTLAPGDYQIKVKTSGFVEKIVPTVFHVVQLTKNETVTVGNISLRNGDINNTNQVNVLNYNLLLGCFGSKQTTSICTAPPTQESSGADLDDSGIVDGIDYNFFLRELSTATNP